MYYGLVTFPHFQGGIEVPKMGDGGNKKNLQNKLGCQQGGGCKKEEIVRKKVFYEK